MMKPLAQPFGPNYAKSVSVLVLGLGESGAAMVRWCIEQGAQVLVADTRTQDKLSESAQHYEALMKRLGVARIHYGDLSADLLNEVKILAISPGLSPLQEPVKSFLEQCQSLDIKVWSEIEFFAQAIQALRDEQGYSGQILAITGTNGKTTTTALTGLLCERAGKSVAVAGNISPAVLDKLLDSDELPDVWVLELSSFQLQHTYTLDADAAAILNISEDHLDWHGDMDHYVAAKAKIFGEKTVAVIYRDDAYLVPVHTALSSQKDRRVMTFGKSVPNTDDSFGIHHDIQAGGMDWLVWAPLIEDEPGRKRKSKKEVLDGELLLKRLMPADALRIKGRHNAMNALAALALTTAIDLPMNTSLHALREYEGEPHRVQSVAIIDGVEYIDDSKGTNVGATLAAIEGLGTTDRQRIILIAGGEGKGQDFEALGQAIGLYVKAVVLMGQDAHKISASIKDASVVIQEVSSMENAVQQASSLAVSGDIILLSPACASFDMFKNYAHRAEVFQACVNELAIERGQVGT